MSGFENFNAKDPFADTGEDESKASNKEDIVHIRIQQRNGRKTLTTVQGLPDDIDPNRVLKVLRKDFACNGNVVKDKLLGEVIQLQGDQRSKVNDFIQKNLKIKVEKIKLHGF
jgi:translation initiation factor 1